MLKNSLQALLPSLGAAVLLASGCSSSSAQTAPVATPSGSPSPSAAGSPSGPAPAPPPLVDRCHTSQLDLSLKGSQGAAGNHYQELHFKNKSGASCTLQGYAGIQNLRNQSQPLPTNVVRGGGFFNGLAKTQFTLAPGAEAPFWIHYSSVPSGSETVCQPVEDIDVIPPDETDPIRLPDAMDVCSQGELDISPVMPPGTTFP